MLTNNDFHLSEEQLARCNAWAAEMAAGVWEGDAMLSHSITVAFTFSCLGRDVAAALDSSAARLELE